MNCTTKRNDPTNLAYSFLYECVERRYFIEIQVQPSDSNGEGCFCLWGFSKMLILGFGMIQLLMKKVLSFLEVLGASEKKWKTSKDQ